MTTLGAVVVALVLLAAVRRSTALVSVTIGATAALPVSAGVVVGPAAAPVFTVAVAVAVACSGRFRAVDAPRSPAPGLLVAFAAWSLAMTALGPWAFAGTPVLEPGTSIDDQVGAPAQLHPGLSNVAQAVYLMTGVTSVLFLRRTGAARRALLAAAWCGTVASTVRNVPRALGNDVLAPVVETMPASFDPTDTRWRGVFAEPSEFAVFSCAVVALALAQALGRRPDEHQGVRLGPWLLAALAVTGLILSASGTAVVAAGALGLVALVATTVRVLLQGGRGAPWYVLGALGAAVVALSVGDALVAPLRTVVEGKVGSQSYDVRSAADALGRAVLGDTYGLGAGLGSNRSSSFAVTLASTTGVPGALLFALVVVVTVVTAARSGDGTPFAWTLFALVLAKSVSAPDLSTPFLWVALAACLPVTVARGSAVDTTDPGAGPRTRTRTRTRTEHLAPPRAGAVPARA